MQHFVDQHPVIWTLFIAVLVSLFLPAFSFVSIWWTGWAQLARVYPAREEFRGVLRRFQSARMRFNFRYGSILTAGVNSEGLYLATWRYFPMFHSPLFIPWSEIYIRKRKKFLSSGIDLELGTDLHIPVTLYGRIADDIRNSPATLYTPL
jgi:hypothetical protein